MTVIQTQESTSAPTEWVRKRLFDLCQFIPGKAHEPFIDPLGEYICVNSKFISTEGQVSKTCIRNITPARKNDILLVMSDLPNGRALGKCFLVDEDDRYAVNQRVCILRPRAANDPQMLFHLLNRNPYFLSFNDGVNQTHLLNSVFEKCELVVPADPTEQERVGEALSDADALIEGLERLIAKKRLIKQGAMQDLLTAKRRLPGFSGEWVETTFRKLLKGAPSYGINSAACPLGSGGYDYLRITDIDEHGHLRQDGRAEVLHPAATQYFLEPDDIVVARTGASTGKSHRYQGPAGRTVYAGFLIKLTPEPESAVASFLFQFMQTDAYWSWITENSARSGQPGINGQQLSGMGLVIPPNVREQQAIALMLGDMEAEIQALEARLEKARQVKEGMMQNLLTGRIRLV